MTIHAVVKKAQQLIAASITTLRAPEYPSDANIAVPTCIAIPTNISFQDEGNFSHTFFDLRLEIMFARGDAKETWYRIDTIPEAVAAIFESSKGGDPTIGGTCQTYEGNITAELATAEIQGIVAVGWIITIPQVKIE